MGARLAAAFIAASAAVWMSTMAMAQEPGNDFWWVCHRTERSSLDAILVGSSHAAQRHLAHGDPLIEFYVGQPPPPCDL